jgi:hypothetical protein
MACLATTTGSTANKYRVFNCENDADCTKISHTTVKYTKCGSHGVIKYCE